MINPTTEPSMIKATNQTRVGAPYYAGVGNESQDQVLFRSDGFEQSRYQNRTVDQSRYSRYYPQQHQQQTPYHNDPASYGDVNSSTFSGAAY